MNPALFYVLAVFSVVVNVVVSICILRELQKRKVKVSFLLCRLLMPWYVHQYGQLTQLESGRVHPLFHVWIVTINLTWVFFLFALAAKYL